MTAAMIPAMTAPLRFLKILPMPSDTSCTPF